MKWIRVVFRRWVSLVSAALLLGVASCTTIDAVTGRKVKNLWSIDDDIQLGSDFFKEIKDSAREEKVPINYDRARMADLKGMLGRLAAVSHLPDLPYEVMLIKTNEVNAMALPGGKVIVLSGLYEGKDALVKGDDELAAVLAHEIAHVNCRHSTEELTRNLPWELLLMGGMLYAEYKEDENLQAIFGGAFLFHQGLIVTKYSRKDEAEADRVGLFYMARAGYDPRAAVRLWERAAQEESKLDDALNILSTHPTSGKRAQKLRELLPEVMPLYEAARSTPSGKKTALASEPAPSWVRIKNPKRSLVSVSEAKAERIEAAKTSRARQGGWVK